MGTQKWDDADSRRQDTVSFRRLIVSVLYSCGSAATDPAEKRWQMDDSVLFRDHFCIVFRTVNICQTIAGHRFAA